jgi:hypothetical protein
VNRAEVEVGLVGALTVLYCKLVGISEIFLLLGPHAVSVGCWLLSNLESWSVKDFAHLLALNHSPHVV